MPLRLATVYILQFNKWNLYANTVTVECNMAACEQNCTSRGCGCRPGYYLLPDRKSCAGKLEC